MARVARALVLYGALGCAATYATSFVLVQFLPQITVRHNGPHSLSEARFGDERVTLWIRTWRAPYGAHLQMRRATERGAPKLREWGVKDDPLGALPRWSLAARLWPDGFARWRDGFQKIGAWEETLVGWPIPCLYGRSFRPDWNQEAMSENVGVLPIGRETRWPNDVVTTSLEPLPLIPLWPQFAMNAALWGGLFAAIVCAIRGVRGRLRKRAGRCAGCGYDLRASPEKCPECGRPVAQHV